MPPYGTDPDWATPGDTSTPAPAPAAPVEPAGGLAATTTESGDSSGGGKTRCTLVMVSCLNIGIAVMMAALGVLTILDFAGDSSVSIKDVTSKPFLAAYMILFATLLFTYELMWWAPMPAINRTLRKNFGFMYGLKGKGLYMIFVAFLCIGLKNEGNDVIKFLNWATGIAFLLTGVLHFFLICTNPDILDKYKPPSAGLTAYGSSTTQAQGDNVV